MLDQEASGPPVVVTLPAQINTANAEQATEQISAAFTPGVTIVVADLTATACRDRSAIRHLLKAHRKAAARGRQVRFAIRPGGPLHRITDCADIHPLLAVYPTPPARHNRQITQASPAIAAAITSSPSMTARKARTRSGTGSPARSRLRLPSASRTSLRPDGPDSVVRENVGEPPRLPISP